MFVDMTNIYLKAGKGGDGAIAFRREKYEPAGGPSGGDGGDGGSIIIRANENLTTLLDFRYNKTYKAENGENGRNKNQFGKDGEDLVLEVPIGTLVKDSSTGKVIVDIKEKNQEFVIARGGKGGKGNARYVSSTRQAPRFAQPGTEGEEIRITLELKLLADVGLIGYPNVGKSTLLSVISNAKPKIANYHFTTLEPNLGMVDLGQGRSYVVADIPGLIEGAHEGVGLGHNFLKHIERTKVLVHLVDTSGFEGRDPVDDVYRINEELYKYNEKLKNKAQILVANKTDLPGSEENYKRLVKEFEGKFQDILAISAVSNKNIKELKYKIGNLLEEIKKNTPEEYETYDEEIEEFKVDNFKELEVKLENGVYVVSGSQIDNLIYRTNFDHHDSLRHFQNKLIEFGVVEKLRELGISDGDTVRMQDFEFEYID